MKFIFFLFMISFILLSGEVPGAVITIKNGNSEEKAFLLDLEGKKQIVAPSGIWFKGTNPKVLMNDGTAIPIRRIRFAKDFPILILEPEDLLTWKNIPALKSDQGNVTVLSDTEQTISPVPVILDDRFSTLNNRHILFAEKKKSIQIKSVDPAKLQEINQKELKEISRRLNKLKDLKRKILDLLSKQREWELSTLQIRLPELLIQEMPSVLTETVPVAGFPCCQALFEKEIQECHRLITAFGCGGCLLFGRLQEAIRKSGKKLKVGRQSVFVIDCPRCAGKSTASGKGIANRNRLANASRWCGVCKNKGKIAPFGIQKKLYLPDKAVRDISKKIFPEKETIGGFRPGDSFREQLKMKKVYLRAGLVKERDSFLGKIYRFPFCSDDPNAAEMRVTVWCDIVIAVEMIYPFSNRMLKEIMNGQKNTLAKTSHVFIQSFLIQKNPMELLSKKRKANRNTNFEDIRSKPVFNVYPGDPFYVYFPMNRDSKVTHISLQCEHEIAGALNLLKNSILEEKVL